MDPSSNTCVSPVSFTARRFLGPPCRVVTRPSTSRSLTAASPAAYTIDMPRLAMSWVSSFASPSSTLKASWISGSIPISLGCRCVNETRERSQMQPAQRTSDRLWQANSSRILPRIFACAASRAGPAGGAGGGAWPAGPASPGARKNLLEAARDSKPLRRISSAPTLTPPKAKASASPAAKCTSSDLLVASERIPSTSGSSTAGSSAPAQRYPAACTERSTALVSFPPMSSRARRTTSAREGSSPASEGLGGPEHSGRGARRPAWPSAESAAAAMAASLWSSARQSASQADVAASGDAMGPPDDSEDPTCATTYPSALRDPSASSNLGLVSTALSSKLPIRDDMRRSAAAASGSPDAAMPISFPAVSRAAADVCDENLRSHGRRSASHAAWSPSARKAASRRASSASTWSSAVPSLTSAASIRRRYRLEAAPSDVAAAWGDAQQRLRNSIRAMKLAGGIGNGRLSLAGPPSEGFRAKTYERSSPASGRSPLDSASAAGGAEAFDSFGCLRPCFPSSRTSSLMSPAAMMQM
mmetsp:Transcript_7219/g.17327  ORF Transcript_7219/g.17327 Transcript_7219/m.17327 type:complete len:530 (+) Transcript_7219:241-1830(+)